MRVCDDVKVIRELLNLTQEELAEKIGVPYEIVNRWENNTSVPEDKHINQLYSFAYGKKVYLNIIHEQMMKEEYNSNDNIVLFHGAKNKIISDLDFSYSKGTNDFGVGFYLGESFFQAATYIAYSKSHIVYSYLLNKKDLVFTKFDVDLDWMLAIAYYRGWIDSYKNHKKIKDIIAKVEQSDVVIAPIADNKMFDLIDEFVTGMTTDLQCKHALSATNLGFQYVLKTTKALAKTKLIEEMFLCDSEREDYLSRRLEYNKIGLDKVRAARIEYKSKGNYIGEILK